MTEGNDISVDACGYCSKQCCGTVKNIVTRPIYDSTDFFSTLKNAFGCNFLLALTSEYVFVKGFMFHFFYSASTPIFMDLLKLPAEQHGVALAVSTLPMAMKGFIGVLSDAWPITGYHKRFYMFISAFIGLIGTTLLTAMTYNLTRETAICFLTMMMIQVAFNDLLCEGAYSRRMVDAPKTGASLTSFVWLCISIGNVVLALWVGPAIEYIGFRALFSPLIIFSLQQVFTILYPWPFKKWSEHSGLLGEEYQANNGIKKDLIKKKWKIFFLAAVLALLALASAMASVLTGQNLKVGITCAAVSGIILFFMIIYCLPKNIGNPALFIFCHTLLVPGVQSQFSYWLKAGKDCVPDGPNFSWTFLLTYTAIIQSIFQIIGVILFQKIVSKWTFRHAYIITYLIQQSTCILDVVIIKRWNLTVFHISDKIWYLFSTGVIDEIAYMWAFMPTIVLISRLCPKGLESTAYATVAGLSNFGRSLSKYIGNFLTANLLDIRTRPTDTLPCDFTNIHWAIIIANGLCPLLPIILTFFLIPNTYMNENVFDRNDSTYPQTTNGDDDTIDQSPKLNTEIFVVGSTVGKIENNKDIDTNNDIDNNNIHGNYDSF